MNRVPDHMITVKVRAGARTREISVGPDGVYKIRTTCPPENNKANEDVIDILAEYLDVPKSQIEIVSGQTSHLKRFRIH